MRTGLVLAVVVFVLVSLAPPARAHGLLVSRPEGAPTPRARRAREPVVLGLHRVEAVIDGPVAHVTVEQVFRNRSDARLEGTYLFPLPDGAAVSHFAMTLGGRMVEGEVMDAAEARRIYESIVRRRRDPGLLEYVGRGLFRARVFPIPPRGNVTIRLSFQQVLPEDGNALEFRYPLATDRLHGSPVEEAVVSVRVKSDVAVKAVYSPSHPLAVTRTSDREVQASFEQSKRHQDRDFLLYVGRSEERVGCSVLSHKAAGEDGTFLAVLSPSVDRGDVPPVPKDVVFVLDVSGSMREHDKIGQAKRALTYGVNVLRHGDRFNVVAFSTGVRSFRAGMVNATPDTKRAAEQWLGDLGAAGGTFIEQALTSSLAMGTKGRLFLVVFLTDGKPTLGEVLTDGLVGIAKKANASNARVFTFGVGYDLQVDLLDRIAEATGGARDYVMPKDELEIVTSRFFRKVGDPVLTDVQVDFGGPVHDAYPSKLPDLFAGGQIVVMGRYPEAGKRNVRLRGRVGEQDVEYVWSVDFHDAERSPFLPRLWAQRKVAFLLDAIRLHGEEQELVDEVKRLATRYAIVTPYTSGLVVEDAELEGRARRRDVVAAGRQFHPAPRRASGGHGGGGAYRGPGDGVPPGLREPSDPTPAAPPPPSGPAPMPMPTAPTTPGSAPPPTTTGPDRSAPRRPALDPRAAEVEASKRLAKQKDEAVEKPASTVKTVEGKTFRWQRDGRWVDTAWEEELKPEQVEAFSDAWTKLLELGPKVAKYLAVGDHVVFVHEGKAYEVKPAD